MAPDLALATADSLTCKHRRQLICLDDAARRVYVDGRNVISILGSQNLTLQKMTR